MLFPRVRTPGIRLRATHPHTQHWNHIHPTSYAGTASFSTSQTRRATSREPNHYEVLEVPITASAAEIKKNFYALSLRHHPDRNRNDPKASSRFARISSAYEILSNHTKRAAYDREHGIIAHHSTHSTANPGQHPMGSHIPWAAPQFYAHGGYGNRKAPRGASSSSAAGGWSEHDPTAFIYRNPVNHFDAPGHYKTQSAEDARRKERRSKEMGAEMNDRYIGSRGDFAVRFIIVCGILVGAGSMTGFIGWPGERGTKASGSKPARRKEE
ncbi:DnaJ domain protein [Aspergillus nomiae NRRL 13137]|uniref:DnaJ domain protein n=1 Tax=Aspergillus nomiae NRRL (strain ATCC 15546 / NRRL 13137 / CBS 260.88 / M93) TaxID=1509407 RepID=A0A0L1J355_ASPN3|nr:DnaJ domain protein [Aspergillus nomiae NRRL 13137]KNG85858.1 DnaJ domain protein [Aspergillus nomiae NRRL 13137]